MHKKLIVLLAVLMSLTKVLYAAPSAYEGCYNRAQNDGQVALCMKAETGRILNQIQDVYLKLSQNHSNTENPKIDEKLQEIYKPWLSYRNRFCSLYTKASEFMFGGDVYKKESCLLELTSEHLDLMKHLLPDEKHNINLNKDPSQSYEECYKKALNNQQLETCMKTETELLFQKVRDNYFALSQNPQTSIWNNGSGLMSGNLKDTYEYWLSYRNKFCTYYADTLSKMLSNKAVWQESCLLNLTADQNKSLETVLLNANSGGEESGEDEE